MLKLREIILSGIVFIETALKTHDIEESIVWLKEECDRNGDGDGFYHNRNSIYDSYQSGKAIVLKHAEKNIGLVTWSEGA